MFAGIVAFEWRYQTYRLTFAAAALFFSVMGFALGASGFGPAVGHLNGTWAVTQSIGLLTLVSVFPLTLFVARALLRDGAHQMEEIVFATSISKGQYLVGRLAGVMLAATATFGCSLIGHAIGTWLIPRDASRIGPFSLVSYLWPALILALPSMLLVATVLVAIAALSRSAIATSVGGVLIYMLYFVAAIFTDSSLMASSSPASSEMMVATAVADPFGISAFYEQTRYWTAAERDARPLAMDGYFLWNRLLWLAISLGVLGLVYRLLPFRTYRDRRGKRAVAEPAGSRSPAVAGLRTPGGSVSLPSAHSSTGRGASWGAFRSAVRLELLAVLRSWPFAVLVALVLSGVGIELFQRLTAAEFGTRLLPTTGLVVNQLGEPLALFGLLVVIYYSAELVWRERAVRIWEMVDATPAPNGVFLLSKLSALCALLCVTTAAGVFVGMAAQLVLGQGIAELALYASLFYFTTLPLLLFGVLCLLLQTVAPNRYVGMLLSVLAALVWHRGAVGGPEHPLLRYAAAPQVRYSAMGGFSPDSVSFGWFMAYWGAVAALVALAACGVWRRGSDTRLRARLVAVPRVLDRSARAAAGLLYAGVLALGGLVLYQTNVVNDYQTDEAVADLRAEYERSFRHLEEVPQPTLREVRLEVDLYPRERRYAIAGRYRLTNGSTESIDTVWVTSRRDVVPTELLLDGKPPAQVEPRFGVSTFQLDSPLEPGSAVELAFELEAAFRGASAGTADPSILENGSFLLSTFALPTVGYRASRELRDPLERRRRGLDQRSRPTTLEAARSSGLERSNLRTTTFEAVVSTSADQMALAPGALRDSWEADGRRFFRYAVDQPMMPFFAFASGRYAIERGRAGDVEIEVYYHPDHGANVGRMLEAASRALRYCTANFGPYPYPSLRIVEIPAFWRRFAGLAQPGVVYLVEDRGFLTDLGDADRLDIVTKRVAHEVSHQWWGHQLSPASEPGASTLVETLARYTEMRVLAAVHGEPVLARLLAVERDRYLRGRTRGDEVPLYQALDQSYLYYAKGAIVMAALVDLVGEGPINRALADLLLAANDSRPPTSLDLVDHLARVTPQPYRPLLDEWWREVTLYDLRVESAVSEPLPDGRSRVTVTVAASKTAVGPDGEVAIPMDEPLDLVLLAGSPGVAITPERIVAESRARITEPRTVLDFVVDVTPDYAVIDPFGYRVDRNSSDNARRIERTPASP